MSLTVSAIAPGLDCLAPSPPGRWDRGSVVVRRDRAQPPGSMVADRHLDTIILRHNLGERHLSDGLVESTTAAIAAAGGGRHEFETAIIGLVRTTVDDPVDAWTAYYRNSLRGLERGTAAFAPVHERAAQLCGGSVLDLGSCFGFFPLRLAAGDPDRSVTATDIHADTMALLGTVAPRLGLAVDTRTCAASALPFADSSVDTVTALHLLEHVDHALGRRILVEACRVARHRVIVAVPYEAHPAACHGHVRSFSHTELHSAGAELGLDFVVDDHHGGWLTIDLP